MKRFLSKLFFMAFTFVCINVNSQTTIPLRVYIEGALKPLGNSTIPLSGDSNLPLMRDNLRFNPFLNSSSIPSNDPYFYPMTNFDITDNYVHVESAQGLHDISNYNTLMSISGDDAIVDWIFVEIRNASDSLNVMATRSGLLQRDGDVVDLDGTSTLMFHNLSAPNYYVVIRHRNHLAVMSSLVSNGQMVDFTNPQTPVYDFGMMTNLINYDGISQNSDVADGYAAMRAGDANGDGKVKISGSNDDVTVIFSDVILNTGNSNYSASYNNSIGYYNSDVDMDGRSKYTSPNDDFSTIYNQVLLYPINHNLKVNYGLVRQQVPQVLD